jgi:hypothetical protein
MTLTDRPRETMRRPAPGVTAVGARHQWRGLEETAVPSTG